MDESERISKAVTRISYILVLLTILKGFIRVLLNRFVFFLVEILINYPGEPIQDLFNIHPDLRFRLLLISPDQRA